MGLRSIRSIFIILILISLPSLVLFLYLNSVLIPWEIFEDQENYPQIMLEVYYQWSNFFFNIALVSLICTIVSLSVIILTTVLIRRRIKQGGTVEDQSKRIYGTTWEWVRYAGKFGLPVGIIEVIYTVLIFIPNAKAEVEEFCYMQGASGETWSWCINEFYALSISSEILKMLMLFVAAMILGIIYWAYKSIGKKESLGN